MLAIYMRKIDSSVLEVTIGTLVESSTKFVLLQSSTATIKMKSFI